MRYVVDTNCISSSITSDFLRQQADHLVIIPYEVLMEAASSGSLDQTIGKFDVLFPFAARVLMLKKPNEIKLVDGNRQNVADALLSDRDTRNFRSNALEMLLDGPFKRDVIENLKLFRESAMKWREQRDARVGGQSEFFDHMRSIFNKKQLAVIRSGGRLGSEISQIMYEMAHDFTVNLYRATNSGIDGPADQRALFDTPFFRWSLVYVNFIVHLLGDGVVRRSSIKAHNDSIDITVSAYATYFDGLITTDKFMAHIHMLVRMALIENGATVPLTDPARTILGSNPLQLRT